VIVFTTVLESEMSTAEVLEYYRFRWQIELVFKRFKSILAMGHLPKYDDQSSRPGSTENSGGVADAKARTPWFCYFPLGLRSLANTECTALGVSSNSLCTNSRKPSHRD